MSIAVAAVIGQVLTFLTVIGGFVVQYLRETRQHQWDVAQRADAAFDLQRRTEAGKAQSRESEARLTKHIETNTEVSKVAFKEANDVNNKLHALSVANQLQVALALKAEADRTVELRDLLTHQKNTSS